MADVQAPGGSIAKEECNYYGGKEGSTDLVHLLVVGMGGFNVVDAQRDECEARGVDQNIDYGSQIVVLGAESIAHL